MQKALNLIQLAKSYQCRLFIAPPDQLRWESPVMPPNELLEELKANKPILIEYLKHTSRDLSILVKRALDGYQWMLDRKRTHYRYNGVPMITARVLANEWRETVKGVLKVDDAELNIIERLLIQSGQLVYFDHAKTFLTTPDQLEQDYLPDDSTGTAFNTWLSMPCEFIYS
ncbi:hypothetical protein [Acinetobacter sp. YH12201]|uniref:hypothetical protein n=1 Tax=Acinetobacter sp. YH12201 TaxID=2601140 RepID=UPI001C553CCD|nr:hypothetical protein [Acinetobacter sp. YH12201]